MTEPPHWVRYSAQNPPAYLKVFAITVRGEAEAQFRSAGTVPGAPTGAWVWSNQINEYICTSKDKNADFS